MNNRIIIFDDIEIEEYKFHKYKSPILLNAVYINEIVVSNKFPFGKQDFNISLVKRWLKNRPFAYSFQKWMYIE